MNIEKCLMKHLFGSILYLAGRAKERLVMVCKTKTKKKGLVHIFFYFWLLRKVLILFIKWGFGIVGKAAKGCVSKRKRDWLLIMVCNGEVLMIYWFHKNCSLSFDFVLIVEKKNVIISEADERCACKRTRDWPSLMVCKERDGNYWFLGLGSHNMNEVLNKLLGPVDVR